MMMTTTMHPVLRDLVSQFCALECCPSGIREALSSFLMTGSTDTVWGYRLNVLRTSRVYGTSHLYWRDVLDTVTDFQDVYASGSAALTDCSAERLTFTPLRRLLKAIPKLHAAELP